MSKKVKLACDLVSQELVASDKLQELLAFFEASDIAFADELAEQREFIVNKVVAGKDVQDMVVAELISRATKRETVDKEVLQSEEGIWKSYGAFSKVPVVTGSVGGVVYRDGKHVCDFTFDENGGFTTQRGAEQSNPFVTEGLLCPDSGLFFLRWSENPGDDTKIGINYEYELIDGTESCSDDKSCGSTDCSA